jgi:hypothetical protein
MEIDGNPGPPPFSPHGTDATAATVLSIFTFVHLYIEVANE